MISTVPAADPLSWNWHWACASTLSEGLFDRSVAQRGKVIVDTNTLPVIAIMQNTTFEEFFIQLLPTNVQVPEGMVVFVKMIVGLVCYMWLIE